MTMGEWCPRLLLSQTRSSRLSSRHLSEGLEELEGPGTADQQLAMTFVTRCAEAFGLTGRWGFQWTNIASEPVIDCFSGGAHVLDLSTGRTL